MPSASANSTPSDVLATKRAAKSGMGMARHSGALGDIGQHGPVKARDEAVPTPQPSIGSRRWGGNADSACQQSAVARARAPPGAAQGGVSLSDRELGWRGHAACDLELLDGAQ